MNDDMQPARGVLLGLLIGVAMWGFLLGAWLL